MSIQDNWEEGALREVLGKKRIVQLQEYIAAHPVPGAEQLLHAVGELEDAVHVVECPPAHPTQNECDVRNLYLDAVYELVAPWLSRAVAFVEKRDPHHALHIARLQYAGIDYPPVQEPDKTWNELVAARHEAADNILRLIRHSMLNKTKEVYWALCLLLSDERQPNDARKIEALDLMHERVGSVAAEWYEPRFKAVRQAIKAGTAPALDRPNP